MSKPFWLLITIFLFASCTGPTPVMSVSSQHNSELEAYAVYATLINQMYVKDQVEQIVIKNQTSLDSFNDDELEKIFQYVARKLPTLQPATLSDFQAKNKQPHSLNESFNLRTKTVLIDKEEENQLLYEGNGSWLVFYERYPKSQGLLTLSRVGFNPEMNQALVYAGNQSGPKTGAGYYVLLTKEGDTWIVKGKYGAWVS